MNKFNIGDKVLPNDEGNGMYKEDMTMYSWYEVYKHENGIVDTYPEGDTKYSWGFSDSNLQLIEQDTKEETTEYKTIKIDIPPQKLLVKSEVSGLDYEKEYKLLLEEYEDLNEELYIAKTAIKMLSELI
jgi:hypothetical protein